MTFKVVSENGKERFDSQITALSYIAGNSMTASLYSNYDSALGQFLIKREYETGEYSGVYCYNFMRCTYDEIFLIYYNAPVMFLTDKIGSYKYFNNGVSAKLNAEHFELTGNFYSHYNSLTNSFLLVHEYKNGKLERIRLNGSLSVIFSTGGSNND